MIRELLRQARTAVIARLGPSSLVLTYHRVAELDSDPQLLAVSPANFDAQAQMLAREFNVIPLTELISALRSRSVPRNAVVLTFDDGYADNLMHAAPALARNGLPATVFVSSGYVGGQREFWWDEVERVAFANEPAGAWNVLRPPSTDAQRVYLELDRRIHAMTAPERDAALADARERFGVPIGVRPTHRPLTGAEVAQLAAVPRIDIGGHTVEHELLSSLSAEAQRYTIAGDRAAFTHLIGRPPSVFSYPYGQRTDFTDETERFVADAGYEGAAANYPGLVKPWTSPYRVPRFVVRDWSAEELHTRIKRWLGGLGPLGSAS